MVRATVAASSSSRLSAPSSPVSRRAKSASRLSFGSGVTRVRMWLFGRHEDGALVGLHAMTTET